MSGGGFGSVVGFGCRFGVIVGSRSGGFGRGGEARATQNTADRAQKSGEGTCRVGRCRSDKKRLHDPFCRGSLLHVPYRP